MCAAPGGVAVSSEVEGDLVMSCESKAHLSLKRMAREVLTRIGFKGHEIFEEYKVADVRVDVAGITENLKVAVECGAVPKAKVEKLRELFDRVIFFPYLQFLPKKRMEVHEKKLSPWVEDYVKLFKDKPIQPMLEELTYINEDTLSDIEEVFWRTHGILPIYKHDRQRGCWLIGYHDLACNSTFMIGEREKLFARWFVPKIGGV